MIRDFIMFIFDYKANLKLLFVSAKYLGKKRGALTPP